MRHHYPLTVLFGDMRIRGFLFGGAMHLIDQSHEILAYDGLVLIERAGRTCYKSEDKISEESAPKFVRQLIKRGHEAMLEHGGATVRFVTNRGVTHELVRHRVAAFAQESTRYVKYDGGMEFIKPVWFDAIAVAEKQYPAEIIFVKACKDAEEYYLSLIHI